MFLPSCVDIIHHTSLGFPSWCPDSYFRVNSCENLMMYGGLYQHTRLVLYIYFSAERLLLSFTAIRFFKKYSNDQEYYYQDDMTQLSTVTKAEHMTDNQLLQNFRTSKFVIRMSRDSYTHLKRHLQENKQNLLLNIVQEHLFIDGWWF